MEVIAKLGGHLWTAHFDQSPLDVVAWHGNYYPYKYDLALFNAVKTVGFDHADPSIFTVLTSAPEMPAPANVDSVFSPPPFPAPTPPFLLHNSYQHVLS